MSQKFNDKSYEITQEIFRDLWRITWRLTEAETRALIYFEDLELSVFGPGQTQPHNTVFRSLMEELQDATTLQS